MINCVNVCKRALEGWEWIIIARTPRALACSCGGGPASEISVPPRRIAAKELMSASKEFTPISRVVAAFAASPVGVEGKPAYQD